MVFTVPSANADYPALAAAVAGNVQNTAWAGGADPSGVSDSTAAIQAALDAGMAYVPPGTYKITGLTLPGGSVLTGPPSAVNTTPTASHVMPAILVLAAGANAHMINVTGSNAYAGNLELDGNKAGQTSGFGCGILYYGQYFLVAERVFVHDQYYRGVNCVSGSGGKFAGCSVTTCGDAGVAMDVASTDNHVRGCLVALNGADGIDTAGYVTHVDHCDVWGNAGNGVKVSGGRGTMITGNGIDHNQQHGVVVTAPSGTYTGSVSIAACTLHSNGLAASGGYNSITVDNTLGNVDGVSIGGCSFWLDGGVADKVAYHIACLGSAAARTHGNQFQPGSYATATINAASQAKDARETG